MSMTISHQPKYSESIHKFQARELNRRLYKFITGRDSIPSDRCYLTLANEQNNSPTSEINQLVCAGLLLPEQFVGIDFDKDFIKKNKKNHPLATFKHGDWNVFMSKREFNPAFVYLDSTHFGDKLPALKTLKNTLASCKNETLVVCNVMETNPRSGQGDIPIDTTILIENLLWSEIPSAYKEWNKEVKNPDPEFTENSLIYIPAYRYKTSKTLMKSYVFYKGVIPKEAEFITFFRDFDKWCEKFERKFCL